MTTPSPARAIADSTTRTVQSHAFGETTVPSSAVMHFASALWGFPDRHDYALLPAARVGLYWLQSVDDELTTFILGDPFTLAREYAFDLSDVDKQGLRVASSDDVMALVMLTLPTTPDGVVTANFRAPLVFNVREQLAVQVVTSDDTHALRTPIDLTAFPPQPDGVRMI